MKDIKQSDILIGELYITVVALKELLIKKNILLESEIMDEIDLISLQVIDQVSKVFPNLNTITNKKVDPTKN